MIYPMKRAEFQQKGHAWVVHKTKVHGRTRQVDEQIGRRRWQRCVPYVSADGPRRTIWR